MPTDATKGWTIFAGSLLAMLGAVGIDIATLMNWQAATTPAFVGSALIHIAATVGAFYGGKGIPVSRDPDTRARRSDLPPALPPPLQPVKFRVPDDLAGS